MSEIGPITIDTPLGPDALTFVAMTGHEGLGEPFEFIVDLVSDDPNIDLTKLLGEAMAIHLDLVDGVRFFHGIVTTVDFVEKEQPGGVYRAVLRPWLSLLNDTANCRIFQNKSVPDIIKQIFQEQGFSDFEVSLAGDYVKYEYLVQYRETDFNFLSRLMEREGIYYYFRHAVSSHTLVLADSVSAHQRSPSTAELPYYPPDAHRQTHIEYVDHWQLTQRVTSGSVALRDFDFEKPSADLTVTSSAPKDHAAAKGEIYDYPGLYRVRNDGQTRARVRLEQTHEAYSRNSGHTNARGLMTGALVELTGHPRDDQNREYLVTWTALSLSGHALTSGGTQAPTFSCEFGALDSHVPFRTQPKTRVPIVEGPQTAIVVGNAGEEIWTDKYGRVKVQFHWDRDGKKDENSSCWVRVSQVWAGSNWGAIHIPRIGQEVIVDFLEGDPDCPIITGRVYNASNMPPYTLPANATQSGIKSRSSKGGAAPNANELRFEDKKGSEEVYLQAEKDMNSLVKHDETAHVQHDRSRTVDHDDSLKVGHDRQVQVDNDETMKVAANRSRNVGGNETIKVSGNESVLIGGNESVTINGNQSLSVEGARSEAVGAAEAITVGGVRAVSVGGAQTVSIGGALGETIGASYSQTVGGSATVSIKGTRTESVGSDETVEISGGQTISVGKKGAISIKQQLTIDAGDEIVIKAGEASITLKKNGDIVLKGKNFTTDASGKVSVKAASDLVLKGSKISAN